MTSIGVYERPARGNWTLRVDSLVEANAKASGQWPGETIAQRALAFSESDPSRILFHDDMGEYDCLTIVAQSRALARAMSEHGIGPGDTISIQIPNWHEAAVINLAAAWLGCVVNPIVPIYRDSEVDFMIGEARTKLLFIPEIFRNYNYRDMAERLIRRHSECHVVVVRGNPGPFDAYQDWLDRAPINIAPAGDADAVKLIMYTSGTTGRPKGVLHSHNTLMAELISIINYWKITSDDVIFMPSPVTHITGLAYGLDLPFVAQARCALLERWEPQSAVAMISAHRCTIGFGATPFLLDLVEQVEKNDVDALSSLRLWPCGGAPVPPEVIRRARAALPNLQASRIYGSTEVPTITLGGRHAALFDQAANTDGEVVVDMRICNVETGAQLGPEEEGEIVAKAPEMFLGYSRVEDNETAFDADGYFRTGDLGMLDSEGALTITGRQKDLIIRGGENISPREVEDALADFPTVHDVAIVAMPHARLGETCCAFVVPAERETFLPHKALAYLSELQIARQKLPERFEIIDSLPRTASGKIKKDILRQKIKDILENRNP